MLQESVSIANNDSNNHSSSVQPSKTVTGKPQSIIIKNSGRIIDSEVQKMKEDACRQQLSLKKMEVKNVTYSNIAGAISRQISERSYRTNKKYIKAKEQLKDCDKSQRFGGEKDVNNLQIGVSLSGGGQRHNHSSNGKKNDFLLYSTDVFMQQTYSSDLNSSIIITKMSEKNVLQQSDDNSSDNSEDYNQKIFLPQKYAKDKAMFRDMFHRQIKQSSRQYNEQNPDKWQRIRYKNLLIDHCNSILVAYGHHIKYTLVDETKKQHRENKITLEHKDQYLQEQEKIMKQLLIKSKYCADNTKIEKAQIKINAQLPRQFFLMNNKEKISLNSILPQMELSEQNPKIDMIMNQEKLIISKYSKIMDKMQKSEQDWKKWLSSENMGINKPKGKESTKSESNGAFQVEGCTKLSFNN